MEFIDAMVVLAGLGSAVDLDHAARMAASFAAKGQETGKYRCSKSSARSMKIQS